MVLQTGENSKLTDEEMLERIRKTAEEMRCPEGLDVESLVTESIEKYWDERAKEVARIQHEEFVKSWHQSPTYRAYRSIVDYLSSFLRSQ